MDGCQPYIHETEYTTKEILPHYTIMNLTNGAAILRGKSQPQTQISVGNPSMCKKINF